MSKVLEFAVISFGTKFEFANLENNAHLILQIKV